MWSVKIEKGCPSWSHIHSNRRMMKARAAANSITTVRGPAGLELVLWAAAVLQADYSAEESPNAPNAQKNSLISLFEEYLVEPVHTVYTVQTKNTTKATQTAYIFQSGNIQVFMRAKNTVRC